MGKKGSWFSAVKKVFSPDSKKDKEKKRNKSKKKRVDKDLEAAREGAQVGVVSPIEHVKLIEGEGEQNKHAYSLAYASAVAAGAAVAAAEAAAEVVRLTSMPHYPAASLPKEELAAIKIQTAFRGYMARRALRALRGLVRLKTLIQGHSVKRQAISTLRCMQTLARLQSQIRDRRIRMSEENKALQRQLQQKQERELDKLRAAQVGGKWDDSLQSKEQIEAKLLYRQEAAFRREKALAYSFSHQQTWKTNSKSVNPTFMDPNNPHWGWSWLERWMAARPWEGQSTIDHHNNDSHTSINTTVARRAVSVGEITKMYSLRDHDDHDKRPRRSVTHKSPSTPASKPNNGKARPISSSKGSAWGGDEDSRSMLSVQSERFRRHSIAGSSVRDDDSLVSSPAFPSYMALTSSAKARSKTQRYEKGAASVSAKKRLSFSPSPSVSRRHSGPPKVEIVSTKDVGTISNGIGR